MVNVKCDNNMLDISSKCPLVGYFFVTICICDHGKEILEYKGNVMHHLGGEYFLVDLFSWIDGGYSYSRIFKIDDDLHNAKLFYEKDECDKYIESFE